MGHLCNLILPGPGQGRPQRVLACKGTGPLLRGNWAACWKTHSSGRTGSGPGLRARLRTQGPGSGCPVPGSPPRPPSVLLTERHALPGSSATPRAPGPRGYQQLQSAEAETETRRGGVGPKIPRLRCGGLNASRGRDGPKPRGCPSARVACATRERREDPCGVVYERLPQSGPAADGWAGAGDSLGHRRSRRGCGWRRLCGTQAEGGPNRAEPNPARTVAPSQGSARIPIVPRVDSGRAGGPSGAERG